jgi:cytosine/adenosine deaminase-related metal-dependent hydrolase
LAFFCAAFYNRRMVRPLHIKNAHIWNGKGVEARDLYTTDVVVDKPPHDALVVDLEGYTIFPGLINAHDHLELNHYPRSKFREVYNNAHEWGEDMNARLDTEPYKSLRAYPLWDRLFIGGLKNLLCGATTVAHHNPLHKYLRWDNFPVRVLQKFGWAHSLHFDTEEEIQRSYKRTPKHIPWFIHLAEGTDENASKEYQRLKTLGCVGENTVIIHGVGFTSVDVWDAIEHVRGLVWCPSTNNYLLGKTTPFVTYTYSAGRPSWRFPSKGGNVALGSDSRLTADGDLLDEMQAGFMTSQCDGDCAFQAHLVLHIYWGWLIEVICN